MGLIEDVGPGKVGVDTAIFIYFIEEAPAWLPIVRPLFIAAEAEQLELITSVVTLLEVLVIPYRANNAAVAARLPVVTVCHANPSLMPRSGCRLGQRLHQIPCTQAPR